MYGRDVYKLSVLVGTKTEEERIVWSKKGNFGKVWWLGQIYLNETEPFWVSLITLRSTDSLTVTM